MGDRRDVEPAPVSEPRPRRHRRKPHDPEVVDGGYRALIAGSGRADGLSEADLIAAVHSAGLDGERIRNVRLLERFALLEVPEDEAERVVAAVNAANGLRLEVTRT